MIPGVNDAEVAITPTEPNFEETQTFSLGYAEPSVYNTFEPGKYEITYRIGTTTLLKHTIVLGKKSYQTLLATGMLSDSLSTNPQTTIHTIKKILAGIESHDANGYMPQFIMLRDLYRGKKEEGMVRLVNASPFAKNVTLKRGKKKLKILAYPLFSEPIPVQPGSKTYNFFLGSIPLAQKEFAVEEGYIHTFITGNSAISNNSITIVSYKTASESIRK